MTTTQIPRPDGRACDALRPVSFQMDIAPHALGSTLVSFGNTRVICAASLERKVPGWMKAQGVEGGWLTAEYAMLPYSTFERKIRDSSRGKVDGRTVEIQRLIGRALRAVVDLKKLPEYTLWVDCDVLQADGGTRTASITGAYVAAYIACERLVRKEQLAENPFKDAIAAVSVGVCQEQTVLDLSYIEDRDASVDSTVVMTGSQQFVEIQSSGEEATFSDGRLTELIGLAKTGLVDLFQFQEKAIKGVLNPSLTES